MAKFTEVKKLTPHDITTQGGYYTLLELSIDYAKVLLLVNRTFSTLLAPSQRIGLARNRAVSNELDADRALWKARHLAPPPTNILEPYLTI